MKFSNVYMGLLEPVPEREVPKVLERHCFNTMKGFNVNIEHADDIEGVIIPWKIVRELCPAELVVDFAKEHGVSIPDSHNMLFMAPGDIPFYIKKCAEQFVDERINKFSSFAIAIYDTESEIKVVVTTIQYMTYGKDKENTIVLPSEYFRDLVMSASQCKAIQK